MTFPQSPERLSDPCSEKKRFLLLFIHLVSLYVPQAVAFFIHQRSYLRVLLPPIVSQFFMCLWQSRADLQLCRAIQRPNYIQKWILAKVTKLFSCVLIGNLLKYFKNYNTFKNNLTEIHTGSCSLDATDVNNLPFCFRFLNLFKTHKILQLQLSPCPIPLLPPAHIDTSTVLQLVVPFPRVVWVLTFLCVWTSGAGWNLTYSVAHSHHCSFYTKALSCFISLFLDP